MTPSAAAVVTGMVAGTVSATTGTSDPSGVRPNRYIALSLAHLERLGIELPDGQIAGVHNAHHEHINLIGHHDINLRAGPRHGHHRPLNVPAELDTLLKRASTNKTATNA